ncbi:MAG: glutamate racemase [Pseudomonadota bacterium]
MASRRTPSPATGRVLVFDSGIGGLTIRDALAASAPGLVIDYAADTAFFPYGEKADAALAARVPEVAEALVAEAKPDVLVIACNTASTLALSETRSRLAIPVIGTVPAIKPAASLTKTGTIGLLATPGTLARAYTSKLIADFAAHCQVIQHGSVDLVHLAERRAAGERLPASEVAAAQAPLFQAPGGEQIDTVVLACTHFPLLRTELTAAAPHQVSYIDSGAAIARQTLKRLEAAPARRIGVDPPAAWVTSPVHPEAVGRVFRRYGYETVRALDVPARAQGV